jgi:dephospho-CoA kinase
VATRIQRVALTGGIATGKSHCLRRFASLGVPVIDADVLARDAVAPGTPGLASVVRRFGPQVLGLDGMLDREALARIVFADAGARRDLEAIVHPVVYAAIQDWFSHLDSQTPFGIADIPLLYETGHAGDFDRVIVAACDVETQLQRVMARDGLTKAEAERRLAAQMPISEKRRKADYVVDTSGEPSETDRRVLEVWERLRADR